MTGIRRPNRRHVRALIEAASGEVCLTTSKVSYRDLRGAELAARELTGQGTGTVEAYACSSCSGWHVGHQR